MVITVNESAVIIEITTKSSRAINMKLIEDYYIHMVNTKNKEFLGNILFIMLSQVELSCNYAFHEQS